MTKQLTPNQIIKILTGSNQTREANAIKQLKIGAQSRTFTFQREAINEEERTVELSFSSEFAVERWYGMETLGHKPEECDLSRLNNAGAFLMDHLMRDQRGVVEKAWLEDGKGRALIRLSNSKRGKELFQEMRDGIRPHISVGYRIVEIVHVKSDKNGLDWYRATKWQPYEISSVSVPADTEVGLGRNDDDSQLTTFNVQLRGITTMDEEEILHEDGEAQRSPSGGGDQPDPPKKGKGGNAERQPSGGGDWPEPPVGEFGVEKETQRCLQINNLGRQFGMDAQAAKAIRDNVSVSEFQNTVLKAVREKNVKPMGTDMNLGLTDNEIQRYSLLSAIRANITGNWKKAGFEREVSVALAEKMGKDSRGFMVNYEILGSMGRAQSTQTEAAGGALVATELHSEKFIELLRPHSMAAQLGVRFVTGLIGDVDIPKLLSGSSFYWIEEGGTPNASEATFGIVQMRPKTIAGAVPITRRLSMQSTPDVDLIIRDDMLQGLGLGIDKAIFVGTGTGDEPLGIVNQTGVNAIDLTTLGLTHPGLVAFETAIENADAMTGDLKYTCNANTKGTLKTTARNANSEHYLWENNELNGYDAHRVSWLAAKAILAGDFRQAMFGTWGALDLMVDKSTNAASGGTVLRVFQDGDVAVRQAKAFAYGQDTTP